MTDALAMDPFQRAHAPRPWNDLPQLIDTDRQRLAGLEQRLTVMEQRLTRWRRLLLTFGIVLAVEGALVLGVIGVLALTR